MTTHKNYQGNNNEKVRLNLERQRYLAQAEFPYCDDVFKKYQRELKIGKGTFGEVFKAKHRITQKPVALKKILMENETEGFPITSLREIKLLRLLKHDNIVNLIEICREGGSNYLVFEFCEHDLAGLLSSTETRFSYADKKNILQQLLNGLHFMHINKILHRDIKSSNVLINTQGILKIADLGLSRAFSTKQPRTFTTLVVTLWYRPPELLLGEKNYGPAVDIWGIGCIMGELWKRQPIMQGESEINQLSLINEFCGSITPEVWPGVDQLKVYKSLSVVGKPKMEDKSKFPFKSKRKVKEFLQRYEKNPCDYADSYGWDLFDKLLTLDPSKRIDADSALEHDFFWTDPMPSNLAETMKKYTTSKFEMLAKKQAVEIRHAFRPAPPPQRYVSSPQGFYERCY